MSNLFDYLYKKRDKYNLLCGYIWGNEVVLSALYMYRGVSVYDITIVPRTINHGMLKNIPNTSYDINIKVFNLNNKMYNRYDFKYRHGSLIALNLIHIYELLISVGRTRFKTSKGNLLPHELREELIKAKNVDNEYIRDYSYYTMKDILHYELMLDIYGC